MENNINNFENQNPVTPNDDDFVIGKGFSIEEEPANKKKEKRKKRTKKNSTLKSIIWVFSIVIISVALAWGIIFLGADLMGIGFGRGEDCVVEIEPGTPTTKIAEQLEECGAVKSPLFFRLYAKLKGYDSQFKYGVYTFNNEAGYESLAEMLMTDGAKAESVKVTIPEGTGITDYVKNVNGENVTVPGIVTLLENAGVCTRSDFMIAMDSVELKSDLLKSVNEGKVYYTLEGYLFPETYDFYSYDSAECAVLAIERMIKESESRITEKMYKRAEEMGYTMNEILTLASIIQMEAGNNTEEMAGVAAVFYNRLNSDEFATLGSSPTCYYGSNYKNDDGRYNTYNVEGLPPGPLCSPGIDAIEAALYPEEKEGYFYFVTDAKGKFYYHKTLAEQNKTIAKLKQENNWVYEYFD